MEAPQEIQTRLDAPNARLAAIKLFTVGGVPLFVHWSFPLGGLLVSGFVGFRIPETYFFCLGYTLLVLFHEFGHAAAASSFGLKVHSITISGLGGVCRFEIPKTFGAAMVTSSAGLLVQCALLIVTLAYVGIFGMPRSATAVSLVTTFIYVNIAIFVLNLIPEKPRRSDLGTDGYLIWKLISRMIRGQPYAYPDTSATFTPETRLHQIAGFVPEGFSTGIEILNDNTNPMEFVVDVMTQHLTVSREKAIELMLAVHTKGGLLVPVDTYEGAVRTAAAISADAAAKGHALVCRAVDARKPKQNHAGAA